METGYVVPEPDNQALDGHQGTSTEPDPWADLPEALRMLKPPQMRGFLAEGQAWNLVLRFCQSHRDLDE